MLRPGRSHRLRHVAALAVPVLMVLAFAATDASHPAPAGAATPAPTATTAVVQMYIGDQRTGPSSIGPLPGATFGLFTANPSASIDDNDGFATATPAYTCVSDADGDCSFVVPIGAGGVPQNTRLWAAAVAAPDGYYANPFWQTAPLTGGVKSSLRHTFQTPPLVAGQSYRAGSNWIGDPGLQTTPASTVPEYARRIASGGVTPLSRVDPELPAICGLNVAVIVDLSSSVNGSVPQLKSAIDSFVDALRGTPSSAALFTFGTDSPADGFAANSGLRSVATTADANGFKALYSSWPNNLPTNYTNWDRGLAAAAAVDGVVGAASHFDIAVMITDGNPTVYGPDPLNANGAVKDRNSGYTRFRELGNGLASANLLKSQGTRILAVGVGDGISDAGAEYNLRTISGRDKYDGGNILDADYFQTADYATAGSALRNVVLASCAPSISVVKRIVPFNGTVADAYTPPNAWQFSAATATPGAAIMPATATTDAQTGATNFDVALPGTTTGTFDLAETQQAGYSLYRTDADGSAAGTQNAGCVDKSSGTDVPVPVTNDGVDGFSVPVGIQGVISCVVYNQAPDFTQASVTVDKRWRVVSDTGIADYPNGAQPGDLQSQLSLGGPGGAGSSAQGWGIARAGYAVGTDSPVAISERTDIALPDCSLTEVTLERGPPDATTPGSGIALDTTSPATSQPLVAGDNAWTITNEVECHSYLTLTKQVASGTGDPTWWTLQAIGPTGDRPGPDGVSGTPEATRIEVTPDVAYQLAESSNTGEHEALHYVQNDNRTRPVEYPLSTGSWACSDAGAGVTPIAIDPSVGNEGAVYVPLGESVVCTAVNETSFLTVVKNVSGGAALPSDFDFRIEPIAPVIPGGHGHDIPGAGAPGATISVAPLQHYALTETSGGGDYELTRLQCVSGDRVFDPSDFYIEPGGTAECTASNTYSPWTVAKSSDPPSGAEVLPGDAITYTLTAYQLEGGPTVDAEVTDDLSEVLDHATLVAGSMVAQAGTATVEGTQLSWSIPSLSGTVTLSYQVEIDADAWNATLRNALTTLTTPDGHDGDPCADTAIAASAGGAECDETVHYTPGEPPSQLADTGSASMPPLWAGAFLLAVGGIALVLARGLRVTARR